MCIPALSAVGSLNPQISLYGVTPPEIVNIAVPFEAPLHSALVVV